MTYCIRLFIILITCIYFSAGAPVVISGTKFKKPPLAGVHYDPYCDYDREGYLVEGDRDEIWAEYNSRRKFNKPDE